MTMDRPFESPSEAIQCDAMRCDAMRCFRYLDRSRKRGRNEGEGLLQHKRTIVYRHDPLFANATLRTRVRGCSVPFLDCFKSRAPWGLSETGIPLPRFGSASTLAEATHTTQCSTQAALLSPSRLSQDKTSTRKHHRDYS